MKYRPSRLFIISLGTLVVVGVTGALAWQKANSASPHDRSSSSFFELATRRIPDLPTFGNPASTQANANARKLVETLKRQYPALDSEKRSVPPEENGFLQLCLLSRMPLNPGPNITPGLERILKSENPLDREECGEALAANADLVERIERIAAMPARSSENMPPGYNGFVDAWTGKYATDILLLKARLAAAAGDETVALNLVRGAFNTGKHYHDLETRTLLGETVSILIDLNTRKAILNHIVPALGSGADLAAWRAVMPPAHYSPADFAGVFRGEWETSARHFLFPVILDPRNKDAPKDGKALALAFSADFNDHVLHVRNADLNQLTDLSFPMTNSMSKSLSADSRDIADYFLIGMRSWGKGYARTATIVAQYEVALDLLVLEKSGGLLEFSSTTSYGTDPFSEKPFVFDPSRRTLSAPDNDREIDPIALP